MTHEEIASPLAKVKNKNYYTMLNQSSNSNAVLTGYTRLPKNKAQQLAVIIEACTYDLREYAVLNELTKLTYDTIYEILVKNIVEYVNSEACDRYNPQTPQSFVDQSVWDLNNGQANRIQTS